MTWIANLFPTSCIQLCISNDACLNSVTTSMWTVQEERRNVHSVSLSVSFLALKHFHWVSRMGKECLARKGEKKHCQGQVAQPRDSIRQLHWIPEPTHYLSLEAWGHWGLVRPACPLPHCHTGIFRGRQGTVAFRRDFAVQLPYCCPCRLGNQAHHPWMALPWPREQQVPILQLRTIKTASFPPSTHFPHLLWWFLEG